MAEFGITFVFIDRGEDGDEPVAVGPFDTEDEARQAGDGRDVMGIWSYEMWRKESE